MKEENNSQFSILNSSSIPPGYKQTEVGVIPEDWNVATLKTLIRPERKITYGIVVPGPIVHNGVPIIRAQDYSKGWVDLDELYRVSPEIDQSYKRSRVITGDVLLTIVGSVGNLAKVPYLFDGSNLTQQTARLSFNAKTANADYFLNILQSKIGKREISNYTKSGVQPSLNLSDVEQFLVPLPTLPEQEAIAEALSDADALLESLEQLLTKKRHLKQGAMQELLTGKKRLPGFENKPGSKQTEVGTIPEDWHPTTIGYLALKVGSGITPKGGSSRYKEYGRPFVRSQNIGWGTLFLSELAYIDDDTHNNFSTTELRQDDVLLNITGASIGRSAIADASLAGGNVNQHVCIIRTNPSEVAARFINYFLLSDLGQRQIDSFQAGGNREGLNFGQIRSIKLPLPPTKTEQTAIATILSDMDTEIAALEAKLAKTRQVKQGMMQALLTGRIRLI